jgi:CubicO group peptidase (beta-lactamase class C family)
MIGAKTMNRSWCGCPLAICTVDIVAFVLTLSASVSAADLPTSDALMLRLMSTHNVPGAALALIKDGRIVLEKGYGFRDVAAQAPVTTATLFNIGSISKSFTALGVAQLVDQHRVDLDAPVVRYVPDLPLSDPQTTQALTLRQLLSHTVAFLLTSNGPNRYRRPERESSVSSPACRSPPNQARGFSIAADASYSRRTSSNGLPASPGRPTLRRTFLRHSGRP